MGNWSEGKTQEYIEICIKKKKASELLPTGLFENYELFSLSI